MSCRWRSDEMDSPMTERHFILTERDAIAEATAMGDPAAQVIVQHHDMHKRRCGAILKARPADHACRVLSIIHGEG
jgi:hypothetical protein